MTYHVYHSCALPYGQIPSSTDGGLFPIAPSSLHEKLKLRNLHASHALCCNLKHLKILCGFWRSQTYFWHLFSKSTLREAHVVKTCSVRKETSTSDIPASRKPDHMKDGQSKPSRYSQCHGISSRRPLPGSLFATDDRYLCRTTTRLPTTTVFLKQRICLPTPSARTWFTS